MNSLRFDCHKVTQMLNFFARKKGKRISKLNAMKLIFLADRYHVRRYGRPISNDIYMAMQYGPVPSNALNLASCDTDHSSPKELKYAREYVKKVYTHCIKSVNEVDWNVLSQSEREALATVWQRFADEHDLVEITHKFREWKKFEKAVEDGGTRVPMDLMDFLEDSPEAESYELYPLNDEERQVRREQLEDFLDVHAFWN